MLESTNFNGLGLRGHYKMENLSRRTNKGGQLYDQSQYLALRATESMKQ